MNRFSDSVENDSFDDILATMDVPTTTTATKPSSSTSAQAKDVGPAKKSRLSSFENEDDSILANMVMPEATTSSDQTAKPTNVPISAGKTNCVLVNPKQRGTYPLNRSIIVIILM